ncbi:MAG: hypothetical protein B1H04_04030 [Planctomycetales bacterium 4484_123]|nr:MAG: hypothetical protein B1H04_04030 [Planctomycetales bacterium 4484_123]
MLNWLDSSWYGNPWRQLRQMQRRMDRLFGEFFRPLAPAFPPVNVYTDDEGAVITAELPGVEAEDLDVTVAGQTVTIRGERKADQPGQDVRWHRQERRFGSFHRQVEVPFGIDPDAVEADYRRGVLEVRLRRAESERPKRVPVRG